MISNIFKVPDLRKRVTFTIMALIVLRIGSHITAPGVDPLGMRALMDNMSGTYGGLMEYFNLFVGGAFKKFTIFALGVMPYISASIIINLLQTVIPHLEQLSKEGEQGRKKIQQYTRIGTIVICIIQATSISMWISGQEGVIASELIGNTVLFTILVVTSITTGTVFLMWLGEQITERGIGNGISLIIFAGIAARIPNQFILTLEQVKEKTVNPISFIAVLVLFAIIIFFVVFEQLGQRRIPVQFARKVVGRKVYGSQSSYLPFKINPSGVIPIIFASALMMVPTTMLQMLGPNHPTLAILIGYLSPGEYPYMVIYGGMVIMFAYYYTQIMFNPVEIASNLKKNGGYVPGIRPGIHTQEFLSKVLVRLTISGSVFLALIAVLPSLILKFDFFGSIPPGFVYLMGGTSLLILVAVDLDTMKQIESQLIMREYDGFLGQKKKKRRSRSR